MILAFDAKDHVVAGEVDLDHHTLGRHVIHQLVWPIVLHDIDAMPDAIGPGDFDGEPHVAAETLRRHEARRKFSRMQAHADLGIRGSL